MNESELKGNDGKLRENWVKKKIFVRKEKGFSKLFLSQLSTDAMGSKFVFLSNQEKIVDKSKKFWHNEQYEISKNFVK